jgi:NAD-specific glutamate dehydrogenase
MLPNLIEQYWRLVPDEELVGRSPQDLLAATAAHRELAEQRLPGELKLRVSVPPEPSEGTHTVLEIVTDDMPFLVDSITGALTGRDLDVHQLVHPQVAPRGARPARRDLPRAGARRRGRAGPGRELDAAGNRPAAGRGQRPRDPQ